MSLCRHYVRELRRSVLMDTPELEKANSHPSLGILDNVGEYRDVPGPSTRPYDEKSPDKHVSDFLRSENDSRHGSRTSDHSANTTPRGEHPPRPSFVTGGNDSSSPGQNSSTSPEHTVARADLRASAEKILYTYLLPGAEREIILPQGIVNEVTEKIEEHGRYDPEVFDAAKDYVFQAMERDAFPGFLRAKALGNIVPPSMMFRLVLGLLGMFGGSWAAFILIFLDSGRRTRCWVSSHFSRHSISTSLGLLMCFNPQLILPFTIGVYSLMSHLYMLDPILALAGFSEYTFMSYSRIREPFVRRLLTKRAAMVLFAIVLIDVALCALFIFVPGVRL